MAKWLKPVEVGRVFYFILLFFLNEVISITNGPFSPHKGKKKGQGVCQPPINCVTDKMINKKSPSLSH